MIITKIELQKNNKKRASLYIDNKFALGLSVETVYDFGLRKNDIITEEQIEDIKRKENQKNTLSYAINLITKHSYSTFDLKRKMLQKGYENHQIEKTVEYLQTYGYLDDMQYAQNYIKDKTRFNNYGSIRLKNELLNKGIDKKIVEDALEQFFDNDSIKYDEYTAAKELAIKKMNSYEKDDKAAKYRKLSGFLIRKGYSYDIVNQVVSELLSYSE